MEIGLAVGGLQSSENDIVIIYNSVYLLFGGLLVFDGPYPRSSLY